MVGPLRHVPDGKCLSEILLRDFLVIAGKVGKAKCQAVHKEMKRGEGGIFELALKGGIHRCRRHRRPAQMVADSLSAAVRNGVFVAFRNRLEDVIINPHIEGEDLAVGLLIWVTQVGALLHRRRGASGQRQNAAKDRGSCQGTGPVGAGNNQHLHSLSYQNIRVKIS